MVGLCQLYSSLVIRHSSFVTRHSSLFTRHSSVALRHSSFVTRHSSLVIRHSSFVTRHSSLVIRHSSFVTRHSSFVTRHSSFVTWHLFALFLRQLLLELTGFLDSLSFRALHRLVLFFEHRVDVQLIRKASAVELPFVAKFVRSLPMPHKDDMRHTFCDDPFPLHLAFQKGFRIGFLRPVDPFCGKRRLDAAGCHKPIGLTGNRLGLDPGADASCGAESDVDARISVRVRVFKTPLYPDRTLDVGLDSGLDHPEYSFQ